MTRMRFALTLVAFSSALAAVAAAAEAFTWSARVQVEGQGGLVVVPATPALYAGIARADLADLRVRNAAGEDVPFAIRSASTPSPLLAPAPVALPIFPLYAGPGADAATLSVRIEQKPGGAILAVEGAQPSAGRARLAGYIVDASAFDGPIEALEVDWDGAGFAGRLRVESSDDLARWAVRNADAPLMALAHEGQTLASRRIPLSGTQAKYVRLTWPASQDTPVFRAVRAVAKAAGAEPERTWQRVAFVPGARGEYTLDLGARPPVDRLRLDLPLNAVLPATLLSRADPAQPWRPAAGAVLYRLERGGAIVAQDELAFPARGDRFWLLRVDPRAGLGDAPLRGAAGYVPHEIVFAARGAPPFAVVFGDAGAASAALPIATLVPGYREDAALQGARGVLDAPDRLPGSEIRARAWLDPERVDGRQLALWSVLVCGVLALALLAWRLARQAA